MADMNSQGQMPSGAMAETVAAAETRATENLGDIWRATANKGVAESTGETMPGLGDIAPMGHPGKMPGE